MLIKLGDAAGRSELRPAPDPAETLTVSTAEIRAHLDDGGRMPRSDTGGM